MTSALPLLDPVASLVAAASLGALLMLGAAGKLGDRALFQAVLDDHRLLPVSWLAPAAVVLPLLELCAGALLLPHATRAAGAVLALVVLALVSAAVAVNLARGRRHVSCGCGGGTHLTLSAGLLARNAALGALAAMALVPVQPRETVWLDSVAAGFATLFLLGLYAVANQMLSHHPRLISLKDAP